MSKQHVSRGMRPGTDPYPGGTEAHPKAAHRCQGVFRAALGPANGQSSRGSSPPTEAGGADSRRHRVIGESGPEGPIARWGRPEAPEASGRGRTPARRAGRQEGDPMSINEFAPLTPEELATEGVTALPDKEVVSILDLAADIDLAIDGAAPIDLAIALNANVVAPITGAVSANILGNGSTSQALTEQGVSVEQHVNADAIATGLQDSTIDQSDTVTGGADPPPTDATPADGTAAAHPALMAATDAAGATADAADAAANAPVDGSVVVD